MKAITVNGFGGVDRLEYIEMEKPKLSSNEVLIQTKAISINPIDVRSRGGLAMADEFKKYHPLILGWDIAGVVVDRGAQATKFDIGDEVFGMVNFLGHGKAYAEYVAAPENHLTHKPINIDYAAAAAATLAALTAWQLLKGYANVKLGQKVLIQAASGGVGHYAVQIAKYLGAHVIATSSLKNRDFVLSLGADEHIAYDEQSISGVVSDMDVVVDAFAFSSLLESLKMVKAGGKLISLLPMISEDVLQKAKEKNVQVHYQLVTSSGADMKAIAGLLEDKVLKSNISNKYPFTEMAAAHLAMETGKTVGKIIVTVP